MDENLLKMINMIHGVIKGKIKNVYLVGSLASGEGTGLNERVCFSDIDLIIDVGFATFLRLQVLHSQKLLSKRLNLALGCHVSPTITCLSLGNYFKFFKPNTLYLCEMSPLSLDDNRDRISSKGACGFPARSDALNLAFSSIADYLFLKCGAIRDVNDEEKSYILAKRCLTLLNSFLIFKGFYSRNYGERIRIAVNHHDSLQLILDKKDIDLLSILTDFKLSGDFKLFAKLPTTVDQDVLRFLYDYFQTLAKKIFAYLLSAYAGYNSIPAGREKLFLHNLLAKYKSNSRLSIANCLFYTMSQILLFLKDRKSIKLKVALYSVFSERLKAGEFLRLLIGSAFLRVLSEEEKLSKENVESLKTLWDQFTG